MKAHATPDRTMMASRFKAECLAILDQVEQMHISVVIVKPGGTGIPRFAISARPLPLPPSTMVSPTRACALSASSTQRAPTSTPCRSRRKSIEAAFCTSM